MNNIWHGEGRSRCLCCTRLAAGVLIARRVLLHNDVSWELSMTDRYPWTEHSLFTRATHANRYLHITTCRRDCSRVPIEQCHQLRQLDCLSIHTMITILAHVARSIFITPASVLHCSLYRVAFTAKSVRLWVCGSKQRVFFCESVRCTGLVGHCRCELF